jgi:hypothetical protein
LPTGQWVVAVVNRGSGTLSLELPSTSPASGTLNGGTSPITFASGEGALVFTDGAGNFTAAPFSTATGGTVTSIGLTVPSRQSVAGSPVTGSGTLAITDNNQSANQVFAGPSSGSAAAPGFRALVAADLPSSLVIGFNVGNGSVGTIVGGYAIAPRSGTVSKCKIVVNAADASTALTFTIKKNGTSVFSSNPTISAGTASGTLSTSTSLTSVPLSVAADDLFKLEITSGGSAWSFTAQLES